MRVDVHAADVVTVYVPSQLVKRGGRKEMVVPEGATLSARGFDSTVVKTLARAFRWTRMLDRGDFATIAELAERAKVMPSYVRRILRSTLLAPEIVESIVAGRQGSEVTLAGLIEPVPVEWESQTAAIRL